MRTIFFILLLLALPAHAAPESAYDRVVSSGTLRCGYGISPPVLVMDANTRQLSGFNYDVMMEIGRELGLKVEFTEEAGWGNFIEGLKTGRYDAFCSMLWPDPARMKFLSLAGPVMYDFAQTYVRRDDHRFDGDLNNLNSADVTLPVVEGDVTVAMTRDSFPNAKQFTLPQTATVSDMFMAVTTRKADALMLTPAMFKDFDAKNPGLLRQVEGVPPSAVYATYFAIKAGEIELRDMLNVALRNLLDDGRLRRLADKYDKSWILPKANY